MKNVLIDNRWAGDTGIGRLCKEVIKYTPAEVNSTFVSSGMGLGNLFSPLMLANEIRKAKPEVSTAPPLCRPFLFRPHIFLPSMT